jgi:hypothetical protein
MGMDLENNTAHAFEMELTRRQVRACTDVEHMREITLSVLDLMEGQRQFFLDHFLLDGRL